MPREFRFLVFTENESASALAEFAPRLGKKLPLGTVRGLEVLEAMDGPPSATLRILPDSGDSIPMSFRSEEIVAALIAYCLKRRIPLPRSGEKVLESLHDRLALRIGVSPLDDPAPKADPNGESG